MLAARTRAPVCARREAARVRAARHRPRRSPARRPTEFAAYAQQHPLGGMPYGMAPLSDAELGVLAAWVAQGAPPPPAPPPLPDAATAQVARWEAFLNGDSLKQRITARYLYEHWFVAHLYFEDLPTGPFFRVVRSTHAARRADRRDRHAAALRRTRASQRFWYRLRPIDGDDRPQDAHRLSAERREDAPPVRRSSWTPTGSRRGCPSYDADEASNPFISFDQIPARSRYQYLLDDAQYFVMTFIRGPVCRGQVAVDVIEDHFFVAFLDPDHDLSVIDPSFLEQAKGVPQPARRAPEPPRARRVLDPVRLRAAPLPRPARAATTTPLDPKRLGPTLDFIWDGDGHNPNAQLTVFRHFDNATVVRGFLGAMPKTAWVIDFPIFERIYYDLVAGYDVFGNVTHQAATRLYMDHLRMQSENLFLTFLPADRRAGDPRLLVRRRDALARLRRRRPPARHLARDADPVHVSPTSKAELLEMILARNPAVSGPPDLLNRCAAPPCDRPGASAVERRAERALQPLDRRARRRGSPSCPRSPSCACAPASGDGRRRGLLAGAQPGAHQRRLHVRRAGAARARRRHAHRGARVSRQLPELRLRRRRRRRSRRSRRRSPRCRTRPTSSSSSRAGACAAPARVSGRRSTGSTTTSAAAQPTEFGLFDLDRYENL